MPVHICRYVLMNVSQSVADRGTGVWFREAKYGENRDFVLKKKLRPELHVYIGYMPWRNFYGFIRGRVRTSITRATVLPLSFVPRLSHVLQAFRRNRLEVLAHEPMKNRSHLDPGERAIKRAGFNWIKIHRIWVTQLDLGWLSFIHCFSVFFSPVYVYHSSWLFCYSFISWTDAESRYPRESYLVSTVLRRVVKSCASVLKYRNIPYILCTV